MKSIAFVLLSVVALSNATFLRELVEFTSVSYTSSCITSANGFVVSLTAASGTSAPSGMTAKFTQGDKSISTAACTQEASSDLVMLCGTLAIVTDTPKGNYTLSLDPSSHTVSNAPSLCYTSECYAVASTQSKTASITYDGDTATNFTITLSAAATTAPTVYAGSVALTCTPAQDKKSTVCTSTKTALEGGKKDEPKTYEVTLGECKLYTGIVLSVSGASFYKLSGIVLAVLALLF